MKHFEEQFENRLNFLRSGGAAQYGLKAEKGTIKFMLNDDVTPPPALVKFLEESLGAEVGYYTPVY